MSKSIQEINQKIKNNQVTVVTAEEMTRLVKELGMTDCVEPVSSFYPVHFGQWRRLLEPDGQIPAEAYAVHFWHQQIRTHGVDMDAAFPESSVFEQLRARYL